MSAALRRLARHRRADRPRRNRLRQARRTDLHALYTAYNPYLGAVEVYFEGNPPLPAAINPAIAGGEAASGAAGHDFDISGLPPCAYILWLSATAQLTSGYGLISGATIRDHIAFCKS